MKAPEAKGMSATEAVKAIEGGTLTSEKLVQLCIARIQAFDRAGPKLHAVISLNPKALEIARALDVERKAGKVRGPLHGIPVVLKDNYNTMDMPTTGGSVLLEGSVPKADAYMVKRLRDAGAIILAKVNMSEFASASTHTQSPSAPGMRRATRQRKPVRLGFPAAIASRCEGTWHKTRRDCGSSTTRRQTD